MKGIQRKNRILCLICAMLAVWMMAIPHVSYAAQRGSINVKTEQPGMTIHLYRVAEKQNGTYQLNEAYAASGADITNGGSRDAALLLADFVKNQNLAADRTGTGSGKHVVFRELSGGEALYLVTGDPVKVGEKTYTPVPILVEAGGAAAEADIKCDVDEPENPTSPTEPTNPTDPTSPTSPDEPEKPTRHHDGSDDNDWDPTPDKKPRTTTAANETATITDAGTTAAAEETSAQEPETVMQEETNADTSGKLPQTGLDWWPVGVFGSLGVILLGAGIVIKRREKEGK